MNYFNEPFTVDNLTALIKKTDLRPLQLVRGAAAADITEDTPDAEIIKRMVDDPNLIQRPIVEVGDKAVVARPIEKALDIL